MNNFFVLLLISILALFGFFSLPSKHQIGLLNLMRGAGTSFSESSSEYIRNNGGIPR